MFYSNFDESSKGRMASILMFIVIGLLITVSVLLFVFLIRLYLHGERNVAILLLPLLPIISLLYASKYLIWILRRITFSDDGIIVHNFYKETLYRWNAIEEYGIFSISLFTTSSITPYFLFMLSSSKQVKKYCNDLSRCFFFRRRVIAVRYSERRNQQLEKIMNCTTKIYDWNHNKMEYEWDPSRETQAPPQSPWPKWQSYEEKRRERKK